MSLLNEQIAMLAKEELPLEKWKDLLSLIDQLCHSGDVNERLVCACTHVIEWEREWNFTHVHSRNYACQVVLICVMAPQAGVQLLSSLLDTSGEHVRMFV